MIIDICKAIQELAEPAVANVPAEVAKRATFLAMVLAELKASDPSTFYKINDKFLEHAYLAGPVEQVGATYPHIGKTGCF